MIRTITPLLLILTVSGCRNDYANSKVNAATPTSNLYANTIDDADQFRSMWKEASGLILHGHSMKFLIDQRSPSAPKVYFINANYVGGCVANGCSKYHFDFAIEALGLHSEDGEAFNSQTYFTQNKRFVAGTVNTYDLPEHGGEIIGIQLYPQDVAKDGTVVEIVKKITSAIRIPGAKLAFVATGNQQTITDGLALQNFAATGALNLSIDQILGSIKYIPMHPGEAWGYLRMFPSNGDTLKPTDIPLFDELPLDLSVVAGTMTRAFQDSNSHVNLKSKERNTPNMVLRDSSTDDIRLAPWTNQPIHLTVKADGWKIEATTPQMIEAKYRERLTRPKVTLDTILTDTILNYDNMCPNSAAECFANQLGKQYGSKAANLGFLKRVFRNRTVPRMPSPYNVLSYDPVPNGFGVPLKFYDDFMRLPANAEIKAKIEQLIAKEDAGAWSADERSAAAAEVREAILKGTIPTSQLTDIKSRIHAIGPDVVKWKVRSSANAEDIPNFDGAGLHDSFSVKPAELDNAAHTCKVEAETLPTGEVDLKVKPKSVACGIKAVYASLWNKRAIEERSFARIDHSSVMMGLSVLPAYDTESPVTANSVVVTRVINSDILGYSLSIQKDNNTVTNPIAGTWSQVTVATLGFGDEKDSLTTTRFAKPTPTDDPLTTPVLSDALTYLMANLARKVEEAYCVANPGYYTGDCRFVALDAEKTKSLDFEMKFHENGQFTIKQVREFNGK